MSARITRIDIDGFRVIDKLSLELQPLNVLIGENGSGKSTVLEAFELIRKAATMNGDQFISEIHNLHGGFRMFRGDGGPGLTRRLKIGVEISSGGETDYHYALELEADAEGGIRVTGEHLHLAPSQGGGPSLKVIERPDLHQHPALVGYTVALVEKLSQRRTVVMTTHSDRVLDALSAPAADHVVLFKRDDRGRTRAFRPNREQLARWLEDYAGLGSLRADGYGSTVFTEEASADLAVAAAL